MKQNLNELLEQIHACETPEEQQAILEREHLRISKLDTESSRQELKEISSVAKEIRKSVEALQKERQVRASIERILAETTDLAVLEVYQQTLLDLVKAQ